MVVAKPELFTIKKLYEIGKILIMSIEKFDRVSGGLTLDQVQVFLAVVEAGSFSAAARRLSRTQSAITYAIQKLEEQFEIELFDRTSYRPTLTSTGQGLLPRARRIANEVGAFRVQARGLGAGLESEVVIALDALFPMTKFVDSIQRFKLKFPSVSLRVLVENLGAATALVLNGNAILGILSPASSDTASLVRHPAVVVKLIPVASPEHPLAKLKGEIPVEVVSDHVQLVLTDTSPILAGRDFGVISPQNWRLGDLSAKHAMLLAGLGWGGMPEHMVAKDLKAGRLVQIYPSGLESARTITMYVGHRLGETLGPVARWLLDEFRVVDSRME
jgi:DNA-binding transcriptional LysR family regulator